MLNVSHHFVYSGLYHKLYVLKVTFRAESVSHTWLNVRRRGNKEIPGNTVQAFTDEDI